GVRGRVSERGVPPLAFASAALGGAASLGRSGRDLRGGARGYPAHRHPCAADVLRHPSRRLVWVVGIVVGVLGVALAARSAQLLAGRGRPRRGPQPAFVLAGPYLRMRNPLYAGVVLGLGGMALA